MVFEYAAGIAAMLFGSFCLAIVSLQFDYAYDAGFNTFEMIFLTGFVSFIATLVYDIMWQCYSVCCKCHTISHTPVTIANNNNNNVNVTITTNDATPLLPTTGPVPPPATTVQVNNRQWLTLFNPIMTIFGESQLFYTFGLVGTISMRWLWLRGFGRTLVFVIFYYSLTMIKFNDAMVIYNTSPVWGLFFDAYLFNSDVLPFHYFISIIAIFGSVLALQPSFVFGNDNDNPSVEEIIGYCLILVCAMIQAGVFAAMKNFTFLQQNNNNNTRSISIIFGGIYSVSLNLIVIGIIGSFLFYQQFLYEIIMGSSSSGEDGIKVYFYICVLSVGLGTVFALYTINYAVARLNTNEVALLSLTEIIWVYAFEVLFFSDEEEGVDAMEVDWLSISGILLVVFSVSLMFGFNIRDQMRHNGGTGNNLNFMTQLLNGVYANNNNNMNGVYPITAQSAVSSASSKGMESITTQLYSEEFGTSQ